MTDIMSDNVLKSRTPFGDIFYFDFDSPIGTSIGLYGLWAQAELRFLRNLIAPGDVVIDGGANVGMHTLAFADACGPEGAVFAVDASPDLAPLLARTISENGLGNVRPLTAALGSDAGTARFARLQTEGPQNTGMLSIVEGNDDQTGTHEVPVVTIDSFELPRLRLIKLDVEGCELSAIRGAADTIARCRPLIAVEALSLGKAVPIFDHLRQQDYSAYFCSFTMFDPDNDRGERNNIFGVAHEASLLFMPDDTVPGAMPGVAVTPLPDIDVLAQLLGEMPRYGDTTDHDRIPAALVRERTDLRAALDRERSVRERFEAAVQGLLRPNAQDDDAMQASANANVPVPAATAGDGVVPPPPEVDAAALAATDAAMRALAQADAAVERADALMVSVQAVLDRLDETDARHLQDVRTLADTMAGLDARATQAEARTETLASEIAALQETQRSARAQNEADVLRLKIELGVLREALLGRAEDRSRFTLSIERIREEIRLLSEQVSGRARS